MHVVYLCIILICSTLMMSHMHTKISFSLHLIMYLQNNNSYSEDKITSSIVNNCITGSSSFALDKYVLINYDTSRTKKCAE